MKARELRQRTAAAYAEARERAEKAETRELTPLTRWYDDETGRVATMLRRHFSGRLKEKFAPQYLLPIRGRLQNHFAGVAERLERRWAPAGASLLKQGAGDATKLIGSLSGKSASATGVPELVATRHAAELARLRADSARGLAQEVGSRTWQGLRAVFEKETQASHLVALAGELMDREAWRLERLVRTETAYGYNLAQVAALKAWPAEEGLLWARWTERVDDLSGRPLDDRVAEDSLLLHGQVVRPGGVFHMPSSSKTPTGLEGKTWAHPPNRPNDRAVVLPWQRDWGVPGWIWQGGRRIELTGR